MCRQLAETFDSFRGAGDSSETAPFWSAGTSWSRSRNSTRVCSWSPGPQGRAAPGLARPGGSLSGLPAPPPLVRGRALPLSTAPRPLWAVTPGVLLARAPALHPLLPDSLPRVAFSCSASCHVRPLRSQRASLAGRRRWLFGFQSQRKSKVKSRAYHVGVERGAQAARRAARGSSGLWLEAGGRGLPLSPPGRCPSPPA